MSWDSGGFMGSAGESSQGMDADAVGMGALGGAGSPTGANYGAITRALIDMFSRYYGGNHSLLGHNMSVFGAPMTTTGPTDVQGAMIGGYLPGPISNTPHNSQLTTVDIRDPNRNTPRNSQLGSVDLTGGPPRNDYEFLANNANILGLGPNYKGIGMYFGGMTPGNSDGGLMSEGGGEYIRKRPRLWDIPEYGGGM